MKDITTQKTIERALSLPSNIPGFANREFVVGISSTGLSLRKKGKTDIDNFMTWDEWVRWMHTHHRIAPTKEGT